MTDATTLSLIHSVTRTVELIGIAVILIGAAYSGARFALTLAGRGTASGVEPGSARRGGDAYKALRSNLGRSILLGLELLVAADIINTVAVEPTLTSIAVLAGIVAIRTFLSFSLELEIEGRWPWQPDRPSDCGR